MIPFRRKPTYPLGLIPSPPDERDWDFPRLAEMVATGEALPVSWDTPMILQQDPDACTGYSIATLCETSAEGVQANRDIDLTLGRRIYQRAREIDNFPDEVKGATLRSALKAAQEMGLISHYARGTWESATDWLRTKGSILWGIPWYKDMFYPKGGVVQATGGYEGGHAICNTGDNMTPEDRMFPNTWGPRWGLNGYCYMSESTLYTCYVAGGEVWTAVRKLEPIVHWDDLPTMNEDDLLSQDATYQRGIMLGYPSSGKGNRQFRPGPKPGQAPEDIYGKVTVHQVGTIMVRLGIKKSNPWNQASDYTMPAKRGWIASELPQLTMNDLDRPLEDVSRFAMMLMVGRYLRGV